MGKESTSISGDTRDKGLIPGSGRFPGEGNGNSLRYSCLKNPRDRGAWRATVHGVTKSRTRLKQLSPHPHQQSKGIIYNYHHLSKTKNNYYY